MENEYQFQLSYYVVGYFDVLAQSTKLRTPPVHPPTAYPATESLNRNLQETAFVVEKFRRLFWDVMKELEDIDKKEVAQIEDKLKRKLFKYSTTSRIHSWGMSDAYVVACPIAMDDPGVIRAAADRHDVHRLLTAAATAWLFLMADGHAIRGGVELGTGVASVRRKTRKSLIL